MRTGQSLGIDEFLLVQWLAPLASEAPEFLIAALLAARGKAGAAMGLLLAAKLNQWTLLVGSLPLAYSFGAGQLAALPLDSRQVSEVLLTQRVLVAGHAGTAVFDLRCDSLIVYRLSRYQPGAFVEIPQRRGSRSSRSCIVVVANPALIEVNFFSALGTAVGKPLEVQNLCRTLKTALRRIGRTAVWRLLSRK